MYARVYGYGRKPHKTAPAITDFLIGVFIRAIGFPNNTVRFGQASATSVNGALFSAAEGGCMVKAVLFDMDGLLLDTEKLLVRFWVQAANEAGFPMKREHALAIRSLHRKFAIPFLRETFGEDFDYVKIRSRRMELMNEYLSENPLELKRGAVELLSFLNENSIPAAIATATDLERTRDYLTRVGIFGYFDKIVCATMVEEGKPKPDIYMYAAGCLKLDPRECMALEDSPNGVRSASSAGCVTVMVPDLTPPDEELSRLAYACVDSLEDVIGLAERLCGIAEV